MLGLERLLGKSQLWVKLDGHDSIGLGGSKLRNLEFLIADALSRKSSTIVLHGLREANFPYLAAARAKDFGLRSILYLASHGDSQRGISTHKMSVVSHPSVTIRAVSRFQLMCRNLLANRQQHHTKPVDSYTIPIGGASPVGCLGGFYAAIELKSQIDCGQMPCPTRICLPYGSGGLAAGLFAGLISCGMPQIQLDLVATSHAPAITRLISLAFKTYRLASGHSTPRDRRMPIVRCHGEYIYGGFTKENSHTSDAVQNAIELDGLLLDTLYSARAYLGYSDLAQDGETSLLWLTSPQGCYD